MLSQAVPQGRPLLTGLARKLVIDVLPAAAASVIGGLLLTQYQFHHGSGFRTAERPAPASAEMLQLVRDEHAMLMDYLQTQLAAEQRRHAAEDAAHARALAEAQAAEVSAAAAPALPADPVLRRSAAAAGSKPVLARSKPASTSVEPARTPQASQLLVQAQPQPSASGGFPTIPPAPEQKSLFAKTVDLKDHVVHATLHAVSAIGSIPSWIAGMGDRIGGTNAESDIRPFTTSS